MADATPLHRARHRHRRRHRQARFLRARSRTAGRSVSEEPSAFRTFQAPPDRWRRLTAGTMTAAERAQAHVQACHGTAQRVVSALGAVRRPIASFRGARARHFGHGVNGGRAAPLRCAAAGRARWAGAGYAARKRLGKAHLELSQRPGAVQARAVQRTVGAAAAAVSLGGQGAPHRRNLKKSTRKDFTYLLGQIVR